MIETVIVGGGLAGASAACALAAASRPVLLIERQPAAADKICGEFISAEAQAYLGELGIDLITLGAHRITGVRLVHGSRVVSATLPFAGFGLSRRSLDEALLHRAAALGAEIRRGETVHVRQERPSIVLNTGAMGDLHAKTLFLATGKHELRGLRRKTDQPADLVGFKVHLRLLPEQEAALSSHVELIMMADGYAGLQCVEANLANLCLLVSAARLRRSGGTWDGLLNDLRSTEPHLHVRLAGAVTASPPVSIFRVPYGFVHAPTDDDPPGVFRLGDQMGVIPSFTGDGMSIALHSAAVAARLHLSGAGAGAYHRRMRRDILGQIRRAQALNRIAGSSIGRALILRLGGVWPGGLRLAASLTRVSPAALMRA